MTYNKFLFDNSETVMLVDNYFGSALTTDVYDELAMFKFKDSLLVNESDLFETKWLDYRHLHPTSATYLFAHHYTSEYRKVYQKIRDVEKGKYVTGSKGKDAMKKRASLAFWKGRQSADELGMPYNLYIGSALRFLIQDTIWQRIPQPTHLYSDKVRCFMINEWDTILKTSIIEPDTSFLIDDNEFNTHHKQEIERYLCEQIMKRENVVFGLSHFMFERNLITENFALQYVSLETIQKAKRLAE